MTPGPVLGSKLTPGTLLRDYFQEPLVRLNTKQIAWIPKPSQLQHIRLFQNISLAGRTSVRWTFCHGTQVLQSIIIEVK